MITKIWKDPVWSKVIAFIIITFIVSIATYFLNLWSVISTFAAQCYFFAFASTSISHWILFILILFALFAILFLAVKAWLKIFPLASSSKHYKTDLFFGVRWRWKFDWNGEICDIQTFCPYCDYEVYAHNSSIYDSIDRIVFFCEDCGCNLGEFPGSLYSLEDKAKRLIDKKIRHGTWSKQNTS